MITPYLFVPHRDGGYNYPLSFIKKSEMNFSQQDKILIKKIAESDPCSLNDILELAIKEHNSLIGRNFILMYDKNRQKYTMGLTTKDGENLGEEAVLNSLFAIDISEVVNLLDYLNRNNYINIVQTSSNFNNRHLLNIGSIKPLPEQYHVGEITNKDLTDTMAKINCSVISKRNNLDKLIKNEFLTDEKLKYKQTLEITSTSAKNSKRLVWLNLLALLLSGLAISYSFKTNKTSQSKAQESIDLLNGINSGTGSLNDNLTAVNDQLIAIPKSLDSFNQEIEDLNTTLSVQQKELLMNSQNIKKGVAGLNEGIEQFEKSIEKYNNQLETTIEQTEEQLELWRKQQEIINQEFSRKPKLRTHFKNCRNINNQIEISSICIHNSGDLSADILSVIIEINASDFISANSKNLEIVRNRNKVQLLISGHSFEDYQVHPDIVKITPIELRVKKNAGDAKINVIYNSKYDDNEKEQTLKLKC